MGLRDWTAENLDGSTGDESKATLAKAVVETVLSLIATVPWALLFGGLFWYLSPIDGLSLWGFSFSGTIDPLGGFLVSLVVLSYLRYRNITCNYP